MVFVSSSGNQDDSGTQDRVTHMCANEECTIFIYSTNTSLLLFGPEILQRFRTVDLNGSSCWGTNQNRCYIAKSGEQCASAECWPSAD